MRIGTDFNIDTAFYDNDSMWFVERRTNVLYQANYAENTIVYHAVIPYSGEDSYRVHPNCVKHHDYIICLPDQGKSIVIYDILNNSIFEINIEVPKGIRIAILNYWIVEDRLWCVSSGMSCIIELNLSTLSIDNYYSIFDDNCSRSGPDAELADGFIICPSYTSNIVSFFDIENKTIKRFDVKSAEKGYNTVSGYDNKIILSGFDKKIYVCNTRDYKIEVINLNDLLSIYDSDGQEIVGLGSSPVFKKSFLFKDKVAFLPWYMPDTIADSIIVYDIEKNKAKAINIIESIRYRDNYNELRYLYFLRLVNDRVIETYCDYEDIKHIDIEKGEISNHPICFERAIYKDAYKMKTNTYIESYKNDIDEFLKMFLF